MGCFCSKQEELVETNNVYILRCEIIFVMIVTSHPFQQNILHEAQEICQGKIEAECICSKCLEHIINLELLSTQHSIKCILAEIFHLLISDEFGVHGVYTGRDRRQDVSACSGLH